MATTTDIQSLFETFAQLTVLVIGDVMTDTYIFGQTERISPEAPVPVVHVQKREDRLGGAANVANNLKALGVTPILAAVVGDDDAGHLFKSALQENGINSAYIILDQDRHTTVKSRVISRNQQMLRFDIETTTPIASNTEILLLDNIIDIIYNEKPDVVIFQDYNKGVLTPKIIANTLHHCKQQQIPTAVDPKFNNFFAYRNCTLFKPNLREAAEGLQMPISPTRPESLAEAHRQIQAVLNHSYTAITLSDKGIFIATPEGMDILPAYLRNIVDVSGAGDTVISLLALGLALDLNLFATAELANIAAGLVCEKVGVSPIDRDELLKEAMLIMGDNEPELEDPA